MTDLEQCLPAQNQWDPILGWVNSPRILEPILVGIGMLTGGNRDFDPWPFGPILDSCATEAGSGQGFMG